MLPSPTCRLHGVTKSVRQRRLLNDITLSFRPGATALLGPNGAGKTTLLKILATVSQPTSGDTEVLGFDPAVAHDRTEIRRRLGYVPQELTYPRGFTVFGFMEYLAVLKEFTDAESRRGEIARVLEITDLVPHATEKIHRLSGGTKRRLAIAQALIGSPSMLLLDEPTVGLDPDQRRLLGRSIEALGERATVVAATQQIDEVAPWCRDVIVLIEGRVAFDGTLHTLIDRARGRVWVSDAPEPAAVATTATVDGRYRHVGRPSAGAEVIEPTAGDAYLLVRHDAAHIVA